MLRLVLLRHAKSSWDDPALSDFDRPLSKRGRAAAPLMGAYLAAHGPRPDIVLLSPAKRTRQTWQRVQKAVPEWTPQVSEAADLYHAEPATLLAHVQALPAVGCALIVGHNPGLHEFAMLLAGRGDAEARARLAAKLPTAGLVVLAFKAHSWARVTPGAGRLTEFVTPADLRASA